MTAEVATAAVPSNPNNGDVSHNINTNQTSKKSRETERRRRRRKQKKNKSGGGEDTGADEAGIITGEDRAKENSDPQKVLFRCFCVLCFRVS